jgi:CRISPR-associated protein Cas4
MADPVSDSSAKQATTDQQTGDDRRVPSRARHRRAVELPDYLPVRMLNEFVYCPRLFFYEWVEGVFAHSADTIEGSLRHEKLETKADALPPPAATGEGKIHARSVELASETYKLIARIDLVEGEGDVVSPVDYKRAAPRDTDDGPEAWPADRAQVCAQALILRDNGYTCTEAVLYYNATKQRVRVAIDDALVAETVQAIAAARALAQSGRIAPPLALQRLKRLAQQAATAEAMDELLGIEGSAARLYFEHFGGMLKVEDEGERPAFDFQHRSRRPPRDPVNALLSFAYSLLTKDLTIVCHSIGFDPFIGFYHQPRFGRPALALDLMEGFRPLVADSAVPLRGPLVAAPLKRCSPPVTCTVRGPIEAGRPSRPEIRRRFRRGSGIQGRLCQPRAGGTPAPQHHNHQVQPRRGLVVQPSRLHAAVKPDLKLTPQLQVSPLKDLRPGRGGPTAPNLRSGPPFVETRVPKR